MDPLAKDLHRAAAEGFREVDVDTAVKEQALRYLSEWLTDPAFAGYRPQLEWLIRRQQWPVLLDSFYQILPFGTGGRRGAVGIGPNRMNLWTLGASVQGHCDYLRERFPGVTALKVVLAYDVRRFEDQRKVYNPDLPNPVLRLTSRNLADHAAGIYVANGIIAHTLPPESTRYLATPELSYAIRLLGAHGGLNISASHNPPDDNGGKFYDERGGQPVPPDDQIMAQLVEQVTTIKTLTWAEAVRTGRVQPLDDSTHKAYIDLCVSQSLIPPPRFDEIAVVYTPLCGVGGFTALEALRGQGFRVTTVDEQMTPDGAFRTVTQSPNPEIPASMDKAEALARATDADLVLATDPDADRLGGMVPAGDGAGPGGWTVLTGNQIVALLTYFKLSKLTEQGRLPRSPIVVKTGVTTGLVTRIARHFGAQTVDNLLVGFKYIADVLWHLDQHGVYEEVTGRPEDFVIGCEESHGVLVTPEIRDKDAAGGALLLAEAALDQKRRGRTLLDLLHEVWKRFGYFHNELVNITMTGIEGKANMARMLERLRTAPPDSVGGLAVTGFEDLRDETGRFGPLKGATDAASRNVLLFQLGDEARIALRPSGTEPKAKAYIEVSSAPCPPNAADAAWAETRRRVGATAKTLVTEFQALAVRMSGG